MNAYDFLSEVLPMPGWGFSASAGFALFMTMVISLLIVCIMTFVEVFFHKNLIRNAEKAAVFTVLCSLVLSVVIAWGVSIFFLHRWRMKVLSGTPWLKEQFETLVAAEITQKEAMKAMADEARNRLGEIDRVVNEAIQIKRKEE